MPCFLLVRMLLALEVGLSLFTKGANAFAMIFAFYKNALRESLEHSPGCEVAGHRMPKDSLRQAERFGRAREQVLGERSCIAHQFIVRHYAIDQSDALGFHGPNHLASEDQLFRFAISDQLHQTRAPAGAGDQPDVVFAKTKLRLVRCDPNVTRQSYLQTRTGARPVDGSEYGLLDQFQLIKELSEPMILSSKFCCGPVAFEVFDVTAGGEGSTCAGEDHNADVFVCLKLGEQAREIIAHFFIDGVEPIGPIERNRRDSVREVKGSRFVAHDGFRAKTQRTAKITSLQQRLTLSRCSSPALQCRVPCRDRFA